MRIRNLNCLDFLCLWCSFLLYLTFINTFAYSQDFSGWVDIGPVGIPPNLKLKIHPESSEKVFLVTKNSILKSIDGGKTWNKKYVFQLDPNIATKDSNIKFLFSKNNSNKLFAVLRNAYQSQDEGQSWEMIYSNPDYRIHYINPEKPNELISSSNGNLLYSSDSGETWENIDEELYFGEKNPVPNPYKYEYFYKFWHNPYSPDIIIAQKFHYSGDILSAQNLHKTQNLGASWDSVNIGAPHALEFFTIEKLIFHPTDSLKIYAKTESSLIWRKTIDGGENWTSLSNTIDSNSFTNSFKDIIVNPLLENGLYTFTSESIYESNDNGETWNQYFTLESDQEIKEVDFDSQNQGYLVTNFGELYRSSVNGQWTKINHDIYYSEPEYIVSSNDGTLYTALRLQGIKKYEETSSDWDLVYSSTSPSIPKLVPSVTDPSLIFVFSRDSNGAYTVLTSRNKGLDFDSLITGFSYYFERFAVASDDQSLYGLTYDIENQAPVIAVSTNGATSFEILDLNGIDIENFIWSPPYQIQVDYFDKKLIYAVLRSTTLEQEFKLIRSLDAGQTWQEITPNLDSNFPYFFVDRDTTGKIYLFDYNKLYISKNSGISWTFIDSLSSDRIIDFEPDPNNSSIYYSLDLKSDLFMSINNGHSWEKINDQSSLRDITVRKLHPTTTEILGAFDQGGIKKLTITNIPISNENPDFENPTVFKLEANYPNPFNPVTIINYSLYKPEYVRLEIFNTLGQKVLVIVDQKQSSGRHTYQVNMSSFSSGVYFYKLEAGLFSNTKKMALIK